MPQRKTILEVIQEHSAPMEPTPTGREPRLRKLPGVRAVVFDVYGTLIQSGVGDISLADTDASNKESAIREALAAAGLTVTDSGVNPLAQLFQDTLSAHQDIRRSDGVDNPEVDIEAVWEDYLTELDAAGVIQGSTKGNVIKNLAVQYEVRVNPVWPMPGMEEMLAELRGKKMPLALVSNAQFYTHLLFPALLDQPLDSLGFIEEACVWSYQLRRGKPSFGLYETCAEYFESKLAIKPAQILYVGNDMLNDIYPAHSIGFKTALFAGDGRSLRLREDREECQDLEPDLVITGLRQILECV